MRDQQLCSALNENCQVQVYAPPSHGNIRAQLIPNWPWGFNLNVHNCLKSGTNSPIVVHNQFILFTY